MTAPAVRTDERTGLLVVDWPHPRPADVVIEAETFDALVVMINIERRLAQSLAVEALALCDHWDANDPAGESHVKALRSIIEGET